jgi:hypothetical protein
MTPNEQYLLKTALQVLEQAGAQGTQESALLSMIEIHVDGILTNIEKRIVLKMLIEKGWAYTYRDPITDHQRYVLTEQGTLAAHAI